ncbi:MAG: PIN domain-containing protein [Lachnospiraceae bacterium]|nr:PIN domain-containing protein [Lachnospiraceae bacterium]
MRWMIDTNIFLDVLIEREPFYKDSKVILEACESHKVQGFISASSATDIFYLVRKHFHNNELAYKALGAVLDIVKVLTVTNEDVIAAYVQRAVDFEDCLLAVCAKANQCDAVITRNKKDFFAFGIAVLTPAEALDLISKDK